MPNRGRSTATGDPVALCYRKEDTMTATPNSDSDCVEFVPDVLDWLDGDDVPPEVVDEAFALLSSRRRRLAIDVMRTHDEELTLPDLAERVAERETGRSLPDISPERVSRTYLSLYHDHLPRLLDAGVLAYDQERDLVAPRIG